jgi:hypothetical protein
MEAPRSADYDEPGPPAQREDWLKDWLSVTAMLADVAFETDADGVFTKFGAGMPLGYPEHHLLGASVTSILTQLPGQAMNTVSFKAICNAISAGAVVWHGPIHLTGADGKSRLYRMALAPRLPAGMAGMLIDLSTVDPLPTVTAFPPDGRYGNLLDPETGFYSADPMLTELGRRFDRLDVEGLPGTLFLLGFKRAPAALRGPVAMRLADELRDIVRPTDLLGRIDTCTIALWCDGMDHLTGGERAARFCAQFPALLPARTLLTVGLVTRWPGRADDPATVTERALVALRLADLACQTQQPAGTGAWHVWQAD